MRDLLREIENGVAAAVSEAVGEYLSTIPTSTGTKPAVVLERMFYKDGTNAVVPPRPDIPYCTVSFTRDERDGSVSTFRTDWEGDDRIYANLKDLYVTVKFMGNRANSVGYIASQARMSFESGNIRNIVREVSGYDVEVTQQSEIRYIENIYTDVYMELREFDLVLRLEDQFTERNSAYFENVEVSSNVK